MWWTGTNIWWWKSINAFIQGKKYPKSRPWSRRWLQLSEVRLHPSKYSRTYKNSDFTFTLGLTSLSFFVFLDWTSRPPDQRSMPRKDLSVLCLSPWLIEALLSASQSVCSSLLHLTFSRSTHIEHPVSTSAFSKLLPPVIMPTDEENVQYLYLILTSTGPPNVCIHMSSVLT